MQAAVVAAAKRREEPLVLEALVAVALAVLRGLVLPLRPAL
jgi:hypothetical protein